MRWLKRATVMVLALFFGVIGLFGVGFVTLLMVSPEFRTQMQVSEAEIAGSAMTWGLLIVLPCLGLVWWTTSEFRKLAKPSIAKEPQALDQSAATEINEIDAGDDGAVLFALLSADNQRVAKLGRSALNVTKSENVRIPVANVEFFYKGTWSAQKVVKYPDGKTTYEPYWVPVEGVGTDRIVMADWDVEVRQAVAAAQAEHTGLNWEEAHQQTALSRDAADEYVRQVAEKAALNAGSRTTSLHVYVEKRFEGTYRIQRESFDVVAGTVVEYQHDGRTYRGLLLNGKTTYAGERPGQLSDAATAIITITVLAIIGVVIAAALGAFS